MRFLVDENVDVGLISWLKKNRHDAKRVPSGISNGSVFALAKKESRILITHDSNFSNMGKYPPAGSPGVIWLRIDPRELGLIEQALQRLFVESRTFAERLLIVGSGRSESLP